MIGAGISEEAAALSWADVATAARELPAQSAAPTPPPPPSAEEPVLHAVKKRRRVDKRPSHKDRAKALSG